MCHFMFDVNWESLAGDARSWMWICSQLLCIGTRCFFVRHPNWIYWNNAYYNEPCEFRTFTHTHTRPDGHGMVEVCIHSCTTSDDQYTCINHDKTNCIWILEPIHAFHASIRLHSRPIFSIAWCGAFFMSKVQHANCIYFIHSCIRSVCAWKEQAQCNFGETDSHNTMCCIHEQNKINNKKKKERNTRQGGNFFAIRCIVRVFALNFSFSIFASRCGEVLVHWNFSNSQQMRLKPKICSLHNSLRILGKMSATKIVDLDWKCCGIIIASGTTVDENGSFSHGNWAWNSWNPTEPTGTWITHLRCWFSSRIGSGGHFCTKFCKNWRNCLLMVSFVLEMF